MRGYLGLCLACGCLAAPPDGAVDTSSGFLAEPVQLPLLGQNAWSAADVSAQVPAGATGVLLAVLNREGANNRIGLRKNGSSDDRNQFGGYSNLHAGYVGVDADRVFEYWIDDPGAQEIWLVGSTGGEALFFDEGIDVSAELGGEWLDVDVRAMPGCEGAIGAYVEHLSETTGAGWGLRAGGSEDSRIPGSSDPRHGWALIGLDDDGIFQQYVQEAGVDLWVVGCQLAGAVFHADAIERTPPEGSWAELPAAPAGATGVIYEVAIFTDVFCDVGVRPAGSAVALEGQGRPNGHAWAVSAVGAGGVVEAFRETSDCKLWEVGTFVR